MTRNVPNVFADAVRLHVDCAACGFRVCYGWCNAVEFHILNCSRDTAPSRVERFAAKRTVHQILWFRFMPLEKVSKVQRSLVHIAIRSLRFCFLDIECHFVFLVSCVLFVEVAQIALTRSRVQSIFAML
jgi:hypothetical protein